MGSLSKSAIYDAGKRSPEKPRVVHVGGERRSEKYPSGVSERFVDLQGNVTQCQLLGPGLGRDQDKITKARNDLHRQKSTDGTVQAFIEHGKCPLRHGLRHLTPIVEEEFAAMPSNLQRACDSDPTVAKRTAKGVEYGEGCPHIEWLIQSRREREATRRAQRSAQQPSVLDMERQKLELAKQQAADAAKTNERLVAALEQSTQAQKPRKATTE